MNFQTFAPTQTQLRILDRLDQVGNLCVVFQLQGAVDEEKLGRAVKRVISNCPPFAYKFLKLNDSLQILVSPDQLDDFNVLNTTFGDEASIYALINTFSNRIFRLDGGAPYLFCLLKGQVTSYLIFACHPALIDRFSLKPLFKAISREYNESEISPVELAIPLGLPQETLLDSERNCLNGSQYHESMRFWLQLIRDSSFEWHPPRLESDLNNNYFSFSLTKDRTTSLTRLAQKQAMGVDDLLLHCFHLFMFRITGNETILTSYTHRIRTGLPGQIGFNENKLAIKSVIDPTVSSLKFLKQAAKLFAQIKFHSDLPAREVNQELLRVDPKFRRASNVLFDEDPLPYRELELIGISSTLLPYFSHSLGTEDVAIYFDIRDQIIFHLLTRSPQEASGLKMAFEHYLALLDHIEEDLDKPVRDLRIFTESLRQRALAFADGGALLSPPADVMLQFIENVKYHSQAPAVRYGTSVLTYDQLFQSASALALQLKSSFVEKKEPLVGIYLPRSEKMIQSIFGVLISGAGYLPLDPQMPEERLHFIIKDARLTAIVTDSTIRKNIDAIAECPIFSIEEMLGKSEVVFDPVLTPMKPECLAYVIYTSGTTGKPKGVMIERGMLAHFVSSIEGLWDNGPGSRWLQFASFNFDASILEIFNPLTHGGELIIAPDDVRKDPEAVFALLGTERVTHAFIPPALLRLIPRRPLHELRTIFCGGEAMDEETVRFWSKAVQLVNCYGPTETSVMATLNTMGGYKAGNQLGRPNRGYQTYLLGEKSDLTPLGGVGEICIAGNGVARGYLGRPELTAQKFFSNPYSPGMLYRTGDLARFLPNGDLEFLGRNDFQVKIRGFRIELGDIENAISEQPEVKGIYLSVLDRQSSKSIVAWYVAPHLSADVLRERLYRRLPAYMVPSFLISMDTFPVNINGKIDRTRLPLPSLTQSHSIVETRQLNDMEIQVRKIWAATLKVPLDSIQVTDHFFHLGGHSLLAALVCNRLTSQLGWSVRPKLLFAYPVFAEFCEQIRISPKVESGFLPLVATESLLAPIDNRLIELMYSHAKSIPADNTYNIGIRIDFSIGVDPEKLRDVFIEVIENNAIFKTSFAEKNSQIWIDAHRSSVPQISIVDATLPEIEARTEAVRSLSLDVSCSPLWRAEILSAKGGLSTLLFCIHHSIFDGWSLNIFLEELATRYEAKLSQKPYHKNRMTWFDYCVWAQELPLNPRFTESADYWHKKLNSADIHVELPVDSHQKQVNSNTIRNIRIDAELVKALKVIAVEKDITLAPLMFSLFLIWIWRLSDQNDLVCMYPYAGRDISGTEEIYGVFVTMGFLRQLIQPNQSLCDLAVAVHRQMLDDKDHLVASPYDSKVVGLDTSNVIFSLQSGIELEGNLRGVAYKAVELPSLTSKGDLVGIFYHRKEGAIEGRIEFDSSLFRAERIDAFVDSFNTLVAAAAKQPHARVGELAYQSPSEISHLFEFSNGPRLDTVDSTIPSRFAEIVRAYPNHVALIFEARSFTYLELDTWSNQIAATLSEHSITASPIGLSMQKSDLLVASVLAILKLGRAYIPLDPKYPPDRLRFFVENCGIRSVLADQESRAVLSTAGLENINFMAAGSLGEIADSPNFSCSSFQFPTVAPSDLAYVIHTSGSTGIPKGVMIEHRTVVKMAQASALAMYFTSESKAALIASMNFDASVLEIFLPLLNGGTLVVMPESVRKEPAKLHQAIQEYQVTHIILSPVVLQNLPRSPIPSLQFLSFGGDTIDEQTADWWARHCRLFSLYGPTETTVIASLGEIIPGSNPHIIGKPLAGNRIYLLNHQKQPVPMGAVGEICIGGDGLARGYLNLNQLTLERFVMDPFGDSPYALMYLTGDLGRYLPDGTIEFLGRKDSQIKLRGFRIELGEIENRLTQFPDIQQVVCAMKGDGDNRHLAAYYVSNRSLDEEELRKHLSKFLPDYMVPSFFVRLAELPSSPNGKINRKALPTLSGKTSENPPRDGLESQIAQIWEEVLRFRGVGRDESFFRLGGNSLLAVRMQAEVRKRLNLEFSISQFYNAPTIEALAAGHQANHIQLAVQDAQNGVEISHPLPRPALYERPQTILLTGAKGFLGIFLLGELSRQAKKIYCLMRCSTALAGMDDLLKQSQAAGVSIDPTRIQVVPGDLAEPDLGLSSDWRKRLSVEVDAILHCGAFVHHLHNYQTMKSANVEGTKELLKLALEEKIKKFCFVSTLSVASALDDILIASETIISNPPISDGGYILTKWVGEQLVAQCADRYGLPAIIARPGNITGCSTTGFSNFANNHFWLFVQGCLQLKAFPNMEQSIEMTPVDLLAQAIVALLMNPRNQSQKELVVANLSNPVTLRLKEFFSKVMSCGFDICEVPVSEWQRRLDSVGEGNGLSQIKEFYTGDLSGKSMPVEQSATLAALAAQRVGLNVNYDALIPIYMSYLQKNGFLKP